MTRIKTTWASVFAALALCAGMTVAAADPASAACYPVDGRLVQRHNLIWSAIGCAVGWAGPTGNGLYQNFERGQMIWSPSQGGAMVVALYRSSPIDIGLSFGYSDPFNYDKWLIRLDRNGANLGQWDCRAGSFNCARTYGMWFWGGQPQGYAYQVVVEGCDIGVGGGHTCRQGWTIPVWLWV